MSQRYSYTPFIWTSVLTILLLVALAIYSGRKRSVPGALPFMIACLFYALWVAGCGLEVASVDMATRIFWIKFQYACILPGATAITCFVLEYAWPGLWLTRRSLALLSIVPLLAVGWLLTDIHHRQILSSFQLYGSFIPLACSSCRYFFAYGYGLSALGIIVLALLFLRSPLHRLPVVLIVTGQIGGRVIFSLEAAGIFQSTIPLDVLAVALEFQMYAIALFGFRIFDPITLARQAVVDQMREGMLVLDPQGRVTSLNPAAERILGAHSGRLRGKTVMEQLPASPSGLLAGTEATEIEFSVEDGQNVSGREVSVGEVRHYTLEVSPLKDWRGMAVGHLLLLHDVTEQKRAQAQIIEQQRTLAMLQERELLARELHDGLGQVLGYVKLQAQAARDRLAQDQTTAAASELEKLVAVAQDAHADVGEYLLGAKIAAADQASFLLALQSTCSASASSMGCAPS